MAQTIISIWNDALQRLGAPRLTSDTDNSREARLCRSVYDGTRRSEIRAHDWNFAIKRVQLAPDLATPAFDFGYQYTLPSDCLRLLRTSDSDLDWTVEGRKILTDTGSVLKIRYIADIEDTTIYDPMFCDALSIQMAVAMCDSLTTSNTKMANLMQLYDQTITEAKKRNAIERGPVAQPDDSFWTVRY